MDYHSLVERIKDTVKRSKTSQWDIWRETTDYYKKTYPTAYKEAQKQVDEDESTQS